MEVRLSAKALKVLGIAGTVATTVLLPLLLWWADKESKGLTIDVLSKASLQAEVPGTTPVIQVTVDGKVVERPFLSQLEISNSGTQPITVADFESAVTIHAGSAQVLQASVTSSSPSSLTPKLTVSRGAIVLAPLLLNSGDRIRVSVVTSNGLPAFSGTARIAGVRDLEVIDNLQNDARFRAWASFTALIALVLMYATLFTAFVYYSDREIKRWALLAGVAGCGVAAFAILLPFGSPKSGSVWWSILIGCVGAAVSIYLSDKLLRDRSASA